MAVDQFGYRLVHWTLVHSVAKYSLVYKQNLIIYVIL